MKITPIDKKQDLFAIENAIPKDLIDIFNSENIEDYEYTSQPWQEDMPRRLLKVNKDSSLFKIQNCLKETFPISKCSFWYDLPGFTMQAHIDNPVVKNVIQYYIGEANKNLGTVFYNASVYDVLIQEDDQRWHLQNFDLPIRHAFNYISNTGYKMINHSLQVHGVPSVVGKNDFRVSAYCYLEE